MGTAAEQLGHLIKRAQHRHHRALDLALADVGLSLVQWNALREIERVPGRSQRCLAACTFNSDQAFGTLTSRLLKQKLIARKPGKGRAYSLVLTPKGRAQLERGHALFASVLERSFSVLSPRERAQLHALLGKLLEGPELTGSRPKRIA